MASQILGDAVARHATDTSADRLDDGHQREAEQHGPSEAVAELGSHLAIGGDTAWIIIRRPGHQTWTQAFQQPHRPQRRLSRRKLCTGWACVNAFLIQTPATALANGRSKNEERLARWLLMADVHDEASSRGTATHQWPGSSGTGPLASEASQRKRYAPSLRKMLMVTAC